MLRASIPRFTKRFDYVLVGGGNSAGYACREFVQSGVQSGRVAVITKEAVLPYERPALTKAYLHPPHAKVRARLPGFHTCVGGGGERQTSGWYEEKGIAFLKGPCTSVDFGKKVLQSSEGSVEYGKLILATGARALSLADVGIPGDDLNNVFYVREEADAARLVCALEELPAGSKVVIIGGGYIGLECAAAVHGWGFETTMVFPEAACMPRLFTDQLAMWLESRYLARGIQIKKGGASGSAVEIAGSPKGSVAGVKLQSGDVLPADLVIVGIGASPNVDFLQGSLLMEAGGIKVDGNLQTSQPDVYAIGDICSFPSRYGGQSRSEHVDHARKSAAHAVQAAMGTVPAAYDYLPYFYSRIFEYTDEPIVFTFFGASSGKLSTEELDRNTIGAVWVSDDKVVGALLMGSPGPSAEEAAKLRDLALAQPAPSTSVLDTFRAAGVVS